MNKYMKLYWTLLIGFGVILFCSFSYADFKSILHYEENFLGAIFNGGLQNFYEYNYERANYYIANGIEGTSYATYDFIMYIVLGIWGIPIYLWRCLTGREVTESFGIMVYGKAIYLVAIATALYLLYRIFLELNIDKQKAQQGVFIGASSLLMLAEVCIIGQSDILGIVFILWGYYEFLKGRLWCFTWIFAIAVSFKIYALFIFVPLLLLSEKNVFKIATKTVIAMGVTVVSGIPFSGNAIDIKKDFSSEMFWKLIENKLPILNREVPIIVVLLGMVYLWCYFREYDSKYQKEMTILVPLVSIVCVFLSFNSFPYWFLHLVPWMTIAIVYFTDKEKELLLLEMAGIACLIAEQFVQYYWCFDIYNCKNMLLDRLFPGAKGYWTETNTERYTSKENDSYNNEYAYPLNTIEKPEIMSRLLTWAEENKVIGLGRWGEWQHYNSDVVVRKALDLANKLKG